MAATAVAGLSLSRQDAATSSSTVAPTVEEAPRRPNQDALFASGGTAASNARAEALCARYTKGELLGRGACKNVYHAFDEEEGIEVAWNEITVNGDFQSVNERERERIFGEIRLLQQLKHKNILALYDWWFDKRNSTLVFITELLNDGSLRSYRRKHRTIDGQVLRRWAWQILQGLVYLHGHNPPIIHRDLKSDNILMNGASGTLKIGDLGFATFRAGFSGAMSVIGTPEFMAPELYEEKYDEKVDIYSFGLCLMELATLEYPYSECRNAAQIFRKVTSGVPPQGIGKITDVELRDFVLLCIGHDAAKRPEARQLLKHPFFEQVRAEQQGAQARCKALQVSLPPTATSASSMSSPQAQPPQQQQPHPQGARATTPGAPLPPPLALHALLPHSQSAATLAVACSSTSGRHDTGGALLQQEHQQQHQLQRLSSITLAITLPSAVQIRQGTVEAMHSGVAAAASEPASASAVASSQPETGIWGSATAVAAADDRYGGAHSPSGMPSASHGSIAQSVGGMVVAGPAPGPQQPQQQTLARNPSRVLTEQPSFSDTTLVGITADGPSFAAFLLGHNGQGSSSTVLSPMASSTVVAAAAALAQQAMSGAAAALAASASGAGATPFIASSVAAQAQLQQQQPGLRTPAADGPVGRTSGSGGGSGGGNVTAPQASVDQLAEMSEDVLLYNGGDSGGNSATAAVQHSGGGARPAVEGAPGEGLAHDIKAPGELPRRSFGGNGAVPVAAIGGLVGSSSVQSPMLLVYTGGTGALPGSGESGGGVGLAAPCFSPTNLRTSAGRGRDCTAIQEDESDHEGVDDDRALGTRVRLACHNQQDNMLAFSMSFINHYGTRRKIGFQYDMDLDTANEVAGEMIENLSLNTHEADFIANLIQKEVARMQHTQHGPLHGGTYAAAVAAGSVGGGQPPAANGGLALAPEAQQQQQQHALGLLAQAAGQLPGGPAASYNLSQTVRAQQGWQEPVQPALAASSNGATHGLASGGGAAGVPVQWQQQAQTSLLSATLAAASPPRVSALTQGLSTMSSALRQGLLSRTSGSMQAAAPEQQPSSTQQVGQHALSTSGNGVFAAAAVQTQQAAVGVGPDALRPHGHRVLSVPGTGPHHHEDGDKLHLDEEEEDDEEPSCFF